MTTHKDIANLDASFLESDNNVVLPEQVASLPVESVAPVQQPTHSESSNSSEYSDSRLDKVNQKTGKTLRTRLLQAVLPAVVLPLGIASWIGYGITVQETRDNAFTQLQQRGLQMSEATDIYIKESFNVATLVGANPLVIDALKAGNKKSASLGLKSKPIEAVEKQFESTKLLEANSSINRFLENAVKATQFAEVFVTDRDGFNVAYSNPTSDFVQSDEDWWQGSQRSGKHIGVTEFDESANATVLPISMSVKDPDSGAMVGILKAGVVLTDLNKSLETFITKGIGDTGIVQLLNVESGGIVDTLTKEGSSIQEETIVGGETSLLIGQILQQLSQSESPNEQEARDKIAETGVTEVSLQRLGNEDSVYTVEFQLQGKVFSLSTIPGTQLVTLAAQDMSEIDAAGRQLLTAFALTALLLGAGAIALIAFLADRLSKPITNLAQTAQQFAAGDLSVRAEVEGTQETQLLAGDFNKMVTRMSTLLADQQRSATEQQEAREKLEMEIYQLLDEVGEATDGDLRVRASLSSMEMSTVADLFNAIIDNLAEIAVQVKQTTGQVSGSLSESEAEIRTLAEQAEAETQNTRNVLKSVATMSSSIQDVAENANQASNIATAAYTSVQEGTQAMDRTVTSIQGLRTTVGETAKKMKRLGESSQKISQVVSLIDEIALKTNLLAINASVEASRAGEQGQGFSVVAEQVGALAEQSAAATKEIAQIVADIQAETNEVTEAMEVGTSQVVDTTNLVESTKASLLNSLERSQEISALMQTISQETGTQAETSQSVTSLMQDLAKLASKRAKSSQSVAESMLSTAQMAQDLEATVAQFKVDDASAS